MGIEPWLGYGQWHIAAKKDLFKAQGLESVKIINFNTDADRNEALATGQLAMLQYRHLYGRWISSLPACRSRSWRCSTCRRRPMPSFPTARSTDIKGLKGKQVAYEEGTTSDILLNYALSQNGMIIADIEKVPMPAADAGSALIAGKVPVAVTYEPYLTLAMQQNPKVKMIYSAGENRAHFRCLRGAREVPAGEARPDRGLAQGLGRGLAEYRKDTAGGRAIISDEPWPRRQARRACRRFRRRIG